MKFEVNVLGHNPVPLLPLGDVILYFLETGQKRAIIYLEAKFKDGYEYNHTWVLITDFFAADIFFIDLFSGETFTLSELSSPMARTLQVGETLRIDYIG